MSKNKKLSDRDRLFLEPPPTNAFKILSQSPPGTSSWHWISASPSPGAEKFLLSRPTPESLSEDYEPKFLLKMAPGTSWSLGDSVPVVVKAGVFITKIDSTEVAPLYVLFQFQGIDRIYEVWIDRHAGDDLPSPLSRLQEMPYLSFLLIEDRPQPERAIAIENQIDWAKLTAKVESVPPWDSVAFNAAKATALSAEELWGAKTKDVKNSTIAKLNDRFRKGDRSLGEYKLSRQVLALPKNKQKQLFKLIQDFSDFNSENNPDGDRSFGVVIVDGFKYIWKIDCLDLCMTMLSEDPSDLTKTTRVLLIIRAGEF